MQLDTTLVRMLRVRHPVLLAAMDIVSDARLTLAVLEAGGYGFLGGGYGEEAWLRRELAVLAPSARRKGYPFGVGFITWSLARQPHLLDLTLEHEPDSIWLSFGDVSTFARRIKDRGAKLVCQVQTEAMAREALDAGADILIAQGAEAGGHGVSRGTLALIPAIADMAGPKIPVVAAGGIADGRGLAACLMLGAAGVALGTRFYATAEAAGNAGAKERIVRASGDESLRSIVFDISRGHVWPAPFTGRCLSNGHARRWFGRELELIRSMAVEGERYMSARANGDYDVAAVIAGEAAGLIHEVSSAADVVQRVVGEAIAIITNASGWVIEAPP